MQLIIFLQGAGDKVMHIEKVKYKKRLFHVLNKFILILILMQLPFKNSLILCTIKLHFHAFNAPVQFDFGDEYLLNFRNFLIKIFE